MARDWSREMIFMSLYILDSFLAKLSFLVQKYLDNNRGKGNDWQPGFGSN
jgi:hypothetical protein